MRKLTVIVVILYCALFVPGIVSANENLTPSGIPLKDLEGYVDEYVEEYIGVTTAGANIVVIKDNQIVLSKGYGYADIENKIPMNPDTSILEWGSVTKLFVWVSVMQLVEQGKIDLNEDVRHYLPQGFLTKLTYDEPITMLNLMNHTAGFEDWIFDLGYASKEKVKSLEEGLKMAEPNQIYRPGEVVAYSNFSTSLAAYIIELITEMEFYDYVTENILEKLDMDHSTIHLPEENREEVIQHVTEGYVLRGLGEFQESTPFYISMYPSGGMNGTAVDLAKFARALMPQGDEKGILFEKEDTLEQMLSTSYSVKENVPGIAHGFWEVDGKQRGYAHSGNTSGFSSNFHIVPEENFAVIVLTNQAAEADIMFGLTKALIGESVFHPVSDAPNSTDIEGTYISARKMGSGFLHLYYYLTPLKVKSLNADEIEISIMGMKGNYIQEDPYTYRFVNGDSGFLPMQTLYFQVEEGAVSQISTAYSDFLPMDKKGERLATHGILFLYCIVFFLVSTIILMVRGLLRWRKKKAFSTMVKWNSILHLSGMALVVNVMVLMVRMLANSNRAYSEIIIHFILNYTFTFTSILSVFFVIWNWRREAVTRLRAILYIISMLSSLLLIALLIYWQFYF
ncbi:serine hydrolase [Oceanobacillus sp. Castelsardo]|uniref:serine hydrolase domain-containing protein n=1 Tax=Oceanobacillus sp. Castelsardo TaxID=1851204 RepID=UPI0008395677|nr:serine hydrolase domain-containing protein [Oceanobacillus sp. Castelsardo]